METSTKTHVCAKEDIISNIKQQQALTNQELIMLKEKLEEFKQENKEQLKIISDSIKEVQASMKGWFDTANRLYATNESVKQLESKVSGIYKAFYWVMGIVGTGIIGAILSLILKTK